MNDLNLMTPEELQEHIQKCQAILDAKQNEKVNQLIGNIASEVHRLLQERPWARVKAEYYDEEREENIDIEIDLEYLTYEDNYIV
jgi:hypothetical protein